MFPELQSYSITGVFPILELPILGFPFQGIPIPVLPIIGLPIRMSKVEIGLFLLPFPTPIDRKDVNNTVT